VRSQEGRFTWTVSQDRDLPVAADASADVQVGGEFLQVRGDECSGFFLLRGQFAIGVAVLVEFLIGSQRRPILVNDGREAGRGSRRSAVAHGCCWCNVAVLLHYSQY